MRRSASSNPPLRAVYRALLRHFGPQGWWPGRGRFEMMVGAILVQNTAWSNVERAIAELRRRRVLSPRALHAAPLRSLARWIRPAGTHTVKARRLRAFTDWLWRMHGGSVDRMFRTPTERLRAELLAIHGIGPETADCILLYAGGRPVFVVDAYTRRVLERHGWLAGRPAYDAVAALFTRALPWDAALFNEYHALLVAVGKTFCRATPRCDTCPLNRWHRTGTLIAL
ncbi:MAG TPA: endonuclease III domain-containing protein [Kiritimatiellia bacterium]|nr:endonuclease III domain-containing protein [Kiritimatiellia bacterium]